MHLTHKFSERQKLHFLGLLVGVLAGFAAVLLGFLIDIVKSVLNRGFDGFLFPWQYLVLPGVGMLLSLLLLRFVIRDDIGHGVTKVLLAVSRNESRIKPHNTWSSLLTSAVTIGFGGSVGAEAPIVYTGAAIGSNLGRRFGLSYRNTTILLGCGAAAAVAGIFKAPLAGILFTMEILLFNMSMSALLPMLLATISATVISCLFRGPLPLFPCTTTAFSMGNIPFYLLLGVLLGFCSLYFTGVTLWLEDRLARIGNAYLRWGLCAAFLGLLIFLFPPLYGEGYDSLGALLDGRPDVGGGALLPVLLQSPWGLPLFFLLVFLLKVLAMTCTNAGGGNGGTFGPTLFCGAVMGFVAARVLNLLGAGVPEQNFALVGMAALMAGVMQAPLTAIFLIAEISGGYALLLPLILAATVSFGTVRIFEKYSIYTKRLAKSGDLLTHDNDRSALTLLNTRDLIRDKYPRMRPDQTLGEVVEVVASCTAAVIAVVDGRERYQGVIDIGNIRQALFRPRDYAKLRVYNLMETAPALIHDTDRMDAVMRKFEATQAWRLPVVDADNRYLGFISRSRLLTAYRAELKEITQD